MIEIRKGNVLDALDRDEVDIVLHVCNNKGVMGSGIAKEIKERFPEAFSAYATSSMKMGTITSTPTGIVNMVAQDGYGKKGYRHLHYGALAECLTEVNRGFPPITRVGIPYEMGAVRAGGDWEIVQEIVSTILPYGFFEVYAYKLED